MNPVLTTPHLTISKGIHPACYGEKNCQACEIQPCRYACQTHEAISLIQAGARAPQVIHLTSLPDKYIKRLYKLVRGKASPRGMAPYSDAWFLENERRAIHATVVWQLYKQRQACKPSGSRTLLDVQRLYHFHVQEILLDFTHIVTALQLMNTHIWHEIRCQICQLTFIGPSDDPTYHTCPSCKLYHRFRCRFCGVRLEPYQQGRPKTQCGECRQ